MILHGLFAITLDALAFKAKYVKMVKAKDPYYLRQKCILKNLVFWQYMTYAYSKRSLRTRTFTRGTPLLEAIL